MTTSPSTPMLSRSFKTIDALVVRSQDRLHARSCSTFYDYHCCPGDAYACPNGYDCLPNGTCRSSYYSSYYYPYYYYIISTGIILLVILVCYLGWRHYQNQKRKDAAALRATYTSSVVLQPRLVAAPVTVGTVAVVGMPVYQTATVATVVQQPGMASIPAGAVHEVQKN
ncbi:hypothetical protein HDU97_003213 [Phlyctochytrium planicorne]|nr:hypothetical protein HDU97_003213 [Phlyctochytrium planicorne]